MKQSVLKKSPKKQLVSLEIPAQCREMEAVLSRPLETREPREQSHPQPEIWQIYSDCRLQHFASGR